MNVRTAPSPPPVPGYETEALAHALHGDPFRVLGPHETPAGRVVRAFLPGAKSAEVLRRSDRARIGRLEHVENGLFQGIVSERAPYLLRITWPGGACRRPRTPTRSDRCWATSTCICSAKAATSSSRMRSAPT